VIMSEEKTTTPVPVLDLSGAPMPNVKTLKARYNLLSQFGKFVGFNLSIMRMVVKEGEH